MDELSTRLELKDYKDAADQLREQIRQAKMTITLMEAPLTMLKETIRKLEEEAKTEK